MSVRLVLETHSTTEDNEAGLATGWLPGTLSAAGRQQAAELGRRRRHDGIAVVLCSDLRRAVETVEIALGGSGIPVLLDWRLRECDYGDLSGAPREQVLGDPLAHLDSPYPHGESWRAAADRTASVLDDVRQRWGGQRVLVVGHQATRYGIVHHVTGEPLASLLTGDSAWRPGWELVVE